MADKSKDWRIVYKSRIRYHSPDYPYRIFLEERGEDLMISQEMKVNGRWQYTHSMGLKRRDLATMLKAIKKHG